MNGHFVDGEFRPAANVRLGVPVALRSGGLVTPAIEAAEQLSVAELAVTAVTPIVLVLILISSIAQDSQQPP